MMIQTMLHQGVLTNRLNLTLTLNSPAISAVNFKWSLDALSHRIHKCVRLCCLISRQPSLHLPLSLHSPGDIFSILQPACTPAPYSHRLQSSLPRVILSDHLQASWV